METRPTITPPATSGIPNSRCSAIAPPMTSARSVAAAMSSACTQNARRRVVGSRWPSSSGRLRPVTSPSFADWYCTSTAMRFAATSTHTSR
ncbi:hypothetical protein CMMCA001_07110 [Clavibacter michiganensis subsp. michiganensis]|nr:hypothetical protein CMMCA001_07110 [Clavibacter michiganensis subsp. michiganensis]